MSGSNAFGGGVRAPAWALISVLSVMWVAVAGCASDAGTGAETTPASPPSKGIIRGTVKIGPLCPVEPCQETPENPYAGRWVVIQTEDGIPIRIPIHEDGTFESQVSPGEYRLDLSKCQYLTCEQELPQPVTVLPGRVAVVEIDIDTGIR